MRLEWLRERFRQAATSPVRYGCSVRVYLLYLLGCIVFTDKSGARVITAYLEFLDDVVDVHTYACGAATLAYI